jgi:hypothetical protein
LSTDAGQTATRTGSAAPTGVTTMPVTNPWLAGPAPTGQLSRGRLEERILNLPGWGSKRGRA